jgi:hypothetical protein
VDSEATLVHPRQTLNDLRQTVVEPPDADSLQTLGWIQSRAEERRGAMVEDHSSFDTMYGIAQSLGYTDNRLGCRH